mmetsp:Transcript_13676/g.30166  ORF Transcript_13676/g.30166 Transcript_13676/m.30166 type:complete len:310 (-) Transcript_13676:592-1521(-)
MLPLGPHFLLLRSQILEVSVPLVLLNLVLHLEFGPVTLLMVPLLPPSPLCGHRYICPLSYRLFFLTILCLQMFLVVSFRIRRPCLLILYAFIVDQHSNGPSGCVPSVEPLCRWLLLSSSHSTHGHPSSPSILAPSFCGPAPGSFPWFDGLPSSFPHWEVQHLAVFSSACWDNVLLYTATISVHNDELLHVLWSELITVLPKSLILKYSGMNSPYFQRGIELLPAVWNDFRPVHTVTSSAALLCTAMASTIRSNEPISAFVTRICSQIKDLVQACHNLLDSFAVSVFVEGPSVYPNFTDFACDHDLKQQD